MFFHHEGHEGHRGGKMEKKILSGLLRDLCVLCGEKDPSKRATRGSAAKGLPSPDQR